MLPLIAAVVLAQAADPVAVWNSENPGYRCIMMTTDGCIAVHTQYVTPEGPKDNERLLLLDHPVKKMDAEEFSMFLDRADTTEAK